MSFKKDYSKNYKSSVKYILPVNVENKPKFVRLPAYYPDLLCLFFKLSGELKASNGKFPYLKAICEYDDFEGTHYKKTFKLEHADSLGITDKQGIINLYYSYKVNEIT